MSGDLGKFSQVVGDADIPASMEHLSAATGDAAGDPLQNQPCASVSLSARLAR